MEATLKKKEEKAVDLNKEFQDLHNFIDRINVGFHDHLTRFEQINLAEMFVEVLRISDRVGKLEAAVVATHNDLVVLSGEIRNLDEALRSAIGRR